MYSMIKVNINVFHLLNSFNGYICSCLRLTLCFVAGEDRWLCTLMLQQGYRVEYSAASDAFTFAPEGFNEFYNQVI